MIKRIAKIILSSYYNLRLLSLRKRELKEFSSVAILCFKPTGIGDLIMNTPAIRSLKQAYPGARIALLTDKDVLKGNPYIDEIILFKDLKEAMKHKDKYDLVILPNKNLLTSRLAFKIRKEYLIGYLSSWKVTGNIKGISGSFDVKSTHLYDMANKVISNLGVITPNQELEPINHTDADRVMIDELTKNNERIITVHPPGLCKSRTWESIKYKELIRRLTSNGYKIVINGAKYDEEYNKQFEMPGVINLTGLIDLYELAALCKKSLLFISGDCGPMHVAISMKTPTITIWGVTNPHRRLPVNGKNFSVCPGGICEDKYYFEKESNDMRINQVSVDEVYEETTKALLQ